VNHPAIHRDLTGVQLTGIATQYGLRSINNTLNHLILLNASNSRSLWLLVNQFNDLNSYVAELSQMIANPLATAAQELASRGMKALSRGWVDEAVADLNGAIEKDPYSVAGHYFLACALAEQGETEAALKQFTFAERYAEPCPTFLRGPTFLKGEVALNADLASAQMGLDASLKKFSLSSAIDGEATALHNLSQTLGKYPTLARSYLPHTVARPEFWAQDENDQFFNVFHEEGVVSAEEWLSKRDWSRDLASTAGRTSFSTSVSRGEWSDPLETNLPLIFLSILSARADLAMKTLDIQQLVEIFEVYPKLAIELSIIEGSDSQFIQDALDAAILTYERRMMDAHAFYCSVASRLRRPFAEQFKEVIADEIVDSDFARFEFLKGVPEGRMKDSLKKLTQAFYFNQTFFLFADMDSVMARPVAGEWDQYWTGSSMRKVVGAIEIHPVNG